MATTPSKSSSRNIDTLSLKPSEVLTALRHMVNRKVSVFLWGPPGIAKSSIIKQLAKELGMDFIDLRLSQMDPTDLRGIPYPCKADDGANVMQWSSPAMLPRDPNAKAIILLDEFNSAPPSVQAGAYQFVLDRRLGDYVVPEGCMIIAAGNRETDKGITFRMATPIANRFVHLEMKADFDDWQRWALEADTNQYVVGYLTAFKHELFQFEAGSASRGFQTPRSWEFVSKTMQGEWDSLPQSVRLALVCGAVGDGQGIKFLEYVKNAADLPDPRKILDGTITTLKKNDVSLCYALTTALCYELRDSSEVVKRNGDKPADRAAWMNQANNFIGYMLNNFQPEVAIMGGRTALSVFKLRLDSRMSNMKLFTTRYRDLIIP